jgi:hypothetical protein
MMTASKLGGSLAVVTCVAALMVVPEVRCVAGLDASAKCWKEKSSSLEALDTSNRLLQDSDLRGLSRESARLMRNEIYARHGYIFRSEDLRQHFGAKSWYRPNRAFSEDLLSPIERANVERLLRFEKSW